MWPKHLKTDSTLGDSFLGAVKSTKNADKEKYGYTGYGIGFVVRSKVYFQNEGLGKIIIFCVDKGLLRHTVHRKKISLSLVKVQQINWVILQ